MRNPLAATLVLAAAVAFSAKAQSPAPSIAAAVADAGRPAADVTRDALRRPAEVLAFSGVKPGDTVIEILPGRGYFTRLFSKVVGPNGRLIAVAPAARDQDKASRAIAADPAYANVTVLAFSLADAAAWPRADVMFTAENYHDFHLKQIHLDVPAVDKALFDALKPGGVLIVADHAAAAGAPVEVADTLHRIDPAVARRELEAAGFVFDGESAVLRRSDDDHTKPVFDPSVRGRTDQFLYRFKKPS